MARKKPSGEKKRRIASGRRFRPGAPPGTLTAHPCATKPVLTVLAFEGDDLVEKTVENVDEIRPLLERYPVTWVNVDGLSDVPTIEALGALFKLHRLALEDVLNLHQRAKSEQYDDNLFIVLHMASLEEGRVVTEQVAIFLGKNFVLTFQGDVTGDSFDAVRHRLRTACGRFSKAGPDYLAYALIDAVVDNYFPVLEYFGDRMDLLEDAVIRRPNPSTLDRIHEIKRDLLVLRKAFWPLREAVNGLVRDQNPLIAPETRIYLRDVHDHIVQVIDILETYREIASGLMDVYLSSVSNEMNEVMRILTVISTIFIPLTFIAGIYGMNFDPKVSPLNMPELEWYFGYPFSLALMSAVAGVLLVYFKRKGWLGTPAHLRARRRAEEAEEAREAAADRAAAAAPAARVEPERVEPERIDPERIEPGQGGRPEG